MKTVILNSITSDIGIYFARRFHEDGWNVIGTYRKKASIPEIEKYCSLLLPCDLSKKEDIATAINTIKEKNSHWNYFISLTGTQLPLGHFFDVNFDEWQASVHVNAIEQLRMVHALYPYREGTPSIGFFAGPGTNNAIEDYSAYVISKIMLIKMCELIDFETDVNIFIAGPGWTKTKMHYETINNGKHLKNYQKTIDFMKENEGTDLEDIYQAFLWMHNQGKKVASGRNFSIVHDPWKGERGKGLAQELLHDPNMYKLRRFKNNYEQP